MSKQLRPSVCIIVENLPVPFDTRVWREACALRDAGYRVSVICPKGEGVCSASYEELEGVEIYRHKVCYGSSVIGYLVEYSWALVAELFLAFKILARTRFRILHGCNPPDTIFIIALILKPWRVRFVFDQHDLTPELFEAKFSKRTGPSCAIVRLAEWSSFRAADVCLVTNESFRELAISRNKKPPDDVFVVRNSPDLSILRRGQVRPEIKCGKTWLAVYVGLMSAQDGVNLLVQSIEHIVRHDNRQDIHFAIVGGGPELDPLRATVTRLRLESFVTFTGLVPHSEVCTYLSNADVALAPDPKTPMNDKLTMAKIPEYMAFALPVVAFDLKETRRIAGDAALYAFPNDPIDYARQVTRLIDNEKLRRQVGAYGRRRVESGLNWGVEKASLLGAYETVLTKSGVAAFSFARE